MGKLVIGAILCGARGFFDSLASSVKNPSVFFSLQIPPYAVSMQVIIIDTQKKLFYIYQTKSVMCVIS